MSRPVPTDRDGRSMVCSIEGCGALGSFGVVGRDARGERTDRRYCRAHLPESSVAARLMEAAGLEPVPSPSVPLPGRLL